MKLELKISIIYLISLYIINYCSTILVIMEETPDKELKVFFENYINYSADRLMDRWRKKLIQLIKRAGSLSIDDIKLIVTRYNSKKKENIMNMDSISEDYYELINDELIESKKNSIISEDQRRKYYLDVIWARKEYNDYKKIHWRRVAVHYWIHKNDKRIYYTKSQNPRWISGTWNDMNRN